VTDVTKFVCFVNVGGYFHGVSTTRTKKFSNFDETFSVCRAFNSKHFDKKSFSNRLNFGGDKFEILKALKTRKSKKSVFRENLCFRIF
jgi:hypothetical protein